MNLIIIENIDYTSEEVCACFLVFNNELEAMILHQKCF